VEVCYDGWTSDLLAQYVACDAGTARYRGTAHVPQSAYDVQLDCAVVPHVTLVSLSVGESDPRRESVLAALSGDSGSAPTAIDRESTKAINRDVSNLSVSRKLVCVAVHAPPEREYACMGGTRSSGGGSESVIAASRTR
jgi:hypothetical protein